MRKTVLVTGGAGYVGTLLVPALIEDGYRVKVFDTFWFWDSITSFLEETGLTGSHHLEIAKADIRDLEYVRASMKDVDYVINLACISNDPCSDLYYDLTHSISYDGVMNVINCAKKAGVKHFVHASSNSVYGIKKEERVTEDLVPEPLTQYSKLKVEIEHYLEYLYKKQDFPVTILRPSTICGYSPRQRLDLTLNMFVDQAYNNKLITIFGGDQYRPTLHVKDMVRIYQHVLNSEDSIGNTYNCGYENGTVRSFADRVKEFLPETELKVIDNPDHRCYRTCSDKLEEELGFEYRHTSADAIQDVIDAFKSKKLVRGEYYSNISVMKRLIASKEIE
tara:strand:- start:1826 stop:2830 length:1005 start_codon:yes stop_codon:yes gene_type:complete